MRRLILLLPLVLAPQMLGQIVLPKPRTTTRTQGEQERTQLSSIESFKRELLQLGNVRRGRDGEDAILRRIGEQYRDLGELILQATRQVEPEQMVPLMKVARRYGNDRHGDEILFQLQVRPLGAATEEVVDTMVLLLGDSAKDALFHCLRSRYAGLRRSAVERLKTRVGPEDIDIALDLSQERKLDFVQVGVSLLGAIDTEESRARLIELLSQRPVVAAAACQALIAHRAAAVSDLQALLRRPPLDRAYGYAAFALISLEEATGEEYLTEDMVDGLVQELGAPDELQRAMVAIALADLIHRSMKDEGTRYQAAQVVEALLSVVSPIGFVANLSTLQEPAERRLVRLSGQEAPNRHVLWRGWWEEAKSDFVGMRRRVEVTNEEAHLAQIALDQGDWQYRVRGDGVGSLEVSERQVDIILPSEQMIELVRQLEALGFMAPDLQQSIRSPLPKTRSLEISVGNARSQVRAPALEVPRYDRMVSLVLEHVDAQKWQLYRNPEEYSDLRGFWEAERRWMEANPEPGERNSRLIELILGAWPTLTSADRQSLALQHLLGIPGKQDLIGEEQGQEIIALALAGSEFGPVQIGLLELALVAKGDGVWRQVLDVLEEQYDVGGREALPRVFSLLGADKVLASLVDGRRRIRLAAMDELVQLRDVRAIPPLVEMLQEEDGGIQRSAIFTLGLLRAQDARQPLIDLAMKGSTPPTLRRETLVALGRIGGPQIPELLRSAMASPVPEDREAAVRGLGELHDPASSKILAQVFVLQGASSLGVLARFSLYKHGALLSIPAVREHLRTGDPAVRRQVVFLLGEFQDPMVIPDLMAMLEEEERQLRVVELLEGITGLDLAPHNNRLALVRDWYASRGDLPQHVWLLDALRSAQVATTLTVDQMTPGSGAQAVQELTRILVDAEQPRLRMLASAVLREVTGEDYGTVSAQTPRSTLENMAVRYRFIADSRRGGAPR